MGTGCDNRPYFRRTEPASWEAPREVVITAGILAYLAAIVVALWGVAPAIPTMNVVRGFGDISSDNRRVIT
jgi:hypothetical protein